MQLYSGNGCCIRTKVVVLGQSGCNWAKVVLFWETMLYSGKSGFIRAICGILAKVVIIKQRCCNRAKVVVLGQKWMLSG